MGVQGVGDACPVVLPWGAKQTIAQGGQGLGCMAAGACVCRSWSPPAGSMLLNPARRKIGAGGPSPAGVASRNSHEFHLTTFTAAAGASSPRPV